MGPGMASIKGNQDAGALLVLEFRKFDEQLQKMGNDVCNSCSGFGHKATDFRKGLLNEKRFCPTGDLIDLLVKHGLVNKE